MRRVMLLVIDSFHPTVFQDCLNSGKVPALAFLAKHGHNSHAISTFPTMTPTASATLATGTHCDSHHVPGFIWYDYKNADFVNYGSSLQALLTLGPIKIFSDLFYNLNDSQLNPEVTTIYEDLEKIGIDSACINFFIRRAGKKHKPNFHWFMELSRIFGLKKNFLAGPDTLIWGEIVGPNNISHLNLQGGIFKKLGVNDSYSSQMVSNLVRTKTLPQFSLVYFPDNDRYSHIYGPLNTHLSIQTVDRLIGEILSSFGSWERALQECHFIAIGDHSQSIVGYKNAVRLDKIFSKYRLSPRGLYFGNDSQLVISANERMAAIDIIDKELDINKILECLAQEKNIGLVMWKKDEIYNILSDGKSLRFNKNNKTQDEKPMKWQIEGDAGVIDAEIYPDAFERISAVLDYGNPTKIILSAPLGWEYYMPGAPIHPGGGSHGSLHSEDSIVPVISAGQGHIFTANRTLDIKQHILKIFTDNA